MIILVPPLCCMSDLSLRFFISYFNWAFFWICMQSGPTSEEHLVLYWFCGIRRWKVIPLGLDPVLLLFVSVFGFAGISSFTYTRNMVASLKSSCLMAVSKLSMTTSLNEYLLTRPVTYSCGIHFYVDEYNQMLQHFWRVTEGHFFSWCQYGSKIQSTCHYISDGSFFSRQLCILTVASFS